tara:strand:+ start:261 stop:452 length:192 start_codon:yes stop_codon:yes gene_type:complete
MIYMNQFEKERRELSDALVNVASQNGDEVITKEIPFKNNDVPTFLGRLDEFEDYSRKRKYMVK